MRWLGECRTDTSTYTCPAAVAVAVVAVVTTAVGDSADVEFLCAHSVIMIIQFTTLLCLCLCLRLCLYLYLCIVLYCSYGGRWGAKPPEPVQWSYGVQFYVECNLPGLGPLMSTSRTLVSPAIPIAIASLGLVIRELLYLLMHCLYNFD